MTPSFFAALIAGAVPIAGGVAFYNFVESGRHGRALLTLGGLVALFVLFGGPV